MDKPETMLAALMQSLRAAQAGPDSMAPPAAILWTDPNSLWLSLKPLLLKQVPELLVFGDYQPELRTGPAIWLRCVVDGTLSEQAIPKGSIPIVYLPGVARQDLRAGEDCRKELLPLVELMYRGTMWLQRSGKDWTVTAFLVSQQGLALDMARDQVTTEALSRALVEVALAPLERLRSRRLEAEDFDKLLSADTIRDLLRWMGEPEMTRAKFDSKQWDAFRNQCKSGYGFDPGKDSELTAGLNLGKAEEPWANVWARFTEAPSLYPGIPCLLSRAMPQELFLHGSHWPRVNEREEDSLREELESIEGMPHPDACQKVLTLEKRHAERRQWVWTSLGLSPLAEVLEPLALLAKIAVSPLGGGAPDEMADFYIKGLWEADAASWEAVALAPVAENRLAKTAVKSLLEPWLEQSARAFQKAVELHPLPGKGEQTPISAEVGTCLLFADGLRYDLGRRLAEQLEKRGFRVDIGRRWAALPTVTASAKPAVAPVEDRILGEELREDFLPCFYEIGKAANSANIRDAVASQGYQILDDHGGPPDSDGAKAWLETGKIDRRGHDLGEELFTVISSEIEKLVELVSGLLMAGWKAVRIITDHGWLLLPGGMPKVNLPKHLTLSRWSRCAVVAGESQVDAATYPWYWNPEQRFVTAPGISCFNASPSYTHGGLSIQECLIPVITVERKEASSIEVNFRTVTWRRLRCFVEIEGAAGLMVDLRVGQPNGPSVVANTKILDEDGTASLVVTGEDLGESDLFLVVVDGKGGILAQRNTKVGVSS